MRDVLPGLCSVLLASSLAIGSALAATPVEIENARPGTQDWKLRLPAHGEIEGYASATSVDRGGQIRLYVNTPREPYYSIDIYRMGWYGGAGGRHMAGPIQRNGVPQAAPNLDPVTHLLECAWTDAYVLTIPRNTDDSSDWASGIYLAKLTTGSTFHQSYIVFVVRDDERSSSFFFQSSVTTYQAYNFWGGQSLYGDHSTPAAWKASFDRPYASGSGAGQFFSFEYNMVRFLEREGRDVTYGTSVDTHEGRNLLSSHAAFLSVGHDEYWSWDQRDHVDAALARGESLLFFSANTSYWQIRYEPSAAGAPLRTIVGYKESAFREDPYALDGNTDNDHLITTRFRDPPVNRPEDAMIGVMYESGNFGIDAAIVIDNPSHWVFARTGLAAGALLPGLLGNEVDRMFADSPAGTVRLAHSPFVASDSSSRYSDMAIRERPDGVFVFATGSIQWSFGLDDYAPPSGPRVQVAAQRITRNVLRRAEINFLRRHPRHPVRGNGRLRTGASDGEK